MARLVAGNADTAAAIGIPAAMFASRMPGPLDATTQALVAPLVEKAALMLSINEAWVMVAIVTLAAIALLPLARTPKPMSGKHRQHGRR